MTKKRLLESVNFYDSYKSYSTTLLKRKSYIYYMNRALSCIKLKWFDYGLGDIKKYKFSNMKYFKILEVKGIILSFLYRYIESRQMFKQILVYSNNFFLKQVKTLEIMIYNPVWIFQTKISFFPTLDGKKCITNISLILDKLKRICNFIQKGWLETIGRVEAFLGDMVFLNLSWIEAKRHFRKALYYLKKCKTLEGNFIMTTLWDRFLICKLKLNKLINCVSLKRCIGHSDKILFCNSLRFAQTLELSSRIMLKKENVRTSIRMLQASLIICREKNYTVQSQIISLNIDKQLSNIFYQRKMMEDSLKHQKHVFNNPTSRIGDKAVSRYSMGLIYYIKNSIIESENHLSSVIQFFKNLKKTNIHGIKALLKNSKRLQKKISSKKANIGENLNNSSILIDAENITKINNKRAKHRFKIQKLGPMCEFLGDGMEKIIT